MKNKKRGLKGTIIGGLVAATLTFNVTTIVFAKDTTTVNTTNAKSICRMSEEVDPPVVRPRG